MEEGLRRRGKKQRPGSSSVAPREDRERSPVREHSEHRQARDRWISFSEKDGVRGIIRRSIESMPLYICSRIVSEINDFLRSLSIVCSSNDSTVHLLNQVYTGMVIFPIYLIHLGVIVVTISDITRKESENEVIPYTQLLQRFCVQAICVFAFLLLLYLCVQSFSVVKDLGEFLFGHPISQNVNDLVTYLLIGSALQILLNLPERSNLLMLKNLIVSNALAIVTFTLLFVVIVGQVFKVFPNRRWFSAAYVITSILLLPTVHILDGLLRKTFPSWTVSFPLLARMFFHLNRIILNEKMKPYASRQQKEDTARESVKKEEKTPMQQKKELHMSKIDDQAGEGERSMQGMDLRTQLQEEYPTSMEETSQKTERESQEVTQRLTKLLTERSRTLPADENAMALDDLKLSETASTMMSAHTSDVILDNLFLYPPSSANDPTEIDSPTSLNCLINETCRSLPSQKSLLYDAIEGLMRIHGGGSVHGELTPKSIVWKKITRRWAIRFSSSTTMSSPSPSEFLSDYTAPEILHTTNDSPAPSAAMDMWSFGVIAFEVIAGTRFYGSPVLPGPNNLTKSAIARRIRIIQNSDASDLLSNLIVLEPESRWSATKAAMSPFFTEDHSASDAARIQKPARSTRNDKCDVCHLRENVLEAHGDESVLVSICIEQYYASGDPADRFGLLNGRAVPVDLDAFFHPKDPVFLLHIEQKYQIRVCTRSNEKLPSDMHLDHVYLNLSDGQGKELEVVSFQISGDGFEMVALLDLGSLHSKKLQRKPSPHLKHAEDYVHLFLDMKISVDSEFFLPSIELKSSLIGKMVPRHVVSPKRDFRKKLEESKPRLPQWMHRHLRGACFVLNANPFEM